MCVLLVSKSLFVLMMKYYTINTFALNSIISSDI